MTFTFSYKLTGLIAVSWNNNESYSRGIHVINYGQFGMSKSIVKVNANMPRVSGWPADGAVQSDASLNLKFNS